MKTKLLLALSCLILGACSGSSGDKSTARSAGQQAVQDSSRKVIACYFHTTQRCASCYKIETYSHEALETAFADALKSGQLEWRMINTDEPENKHFIQDFSLFTKSLILIEMKDGKEARWKNCGKVWEYLNNKAKFTSYVQDEVRGYLSGS